MPPESSAAIREEQPHGIQLVLLPGLGGAGILFEALLKELSPEAEREFVLAWKCESCKYRPYE
jgi:hypothetical protein